MAEDKDTRDEKANEEQDERQQEKGAEEQQEKDDKEKSDPVETDDKPTDKSDDKPQDSDIPHADIEARIDGLAQSMNSLIDLCTSILGAVQKEEPVAEESHDPSDPDKKDDRLDDFASLLD